jgi:DNA polymerase-3 subunit gamma/tau
MQAMEITGGGESLTKKIVESAKPVAFRSIPAMQPLQPIKKAEPKLVIQSEPEVQQRPQQKTVPPTAPPAAAIKAEPAKTTPPEMVPAQQEPAVASPDLKTSQLEKLRKQIAERNSSSTASRAQSLELEKLKDAWQSYTDHLKEKKNPAVPSFQRASLNILSEKSFEVITNNNLEQKFIEQEKRALSEYVQKIFSNRLIHFSVKITNTPVDPEPVEKTMTKKEQFISIVEQYPLVKELKDRLGLELDY